MRTLQEIKAELLTQNILRKYILNDEEFELTDSEFNKAIEDKAKMILEQEQDAAEKEAIRQAKISAYTKLGLTADEIAVLLDDNKSNAQ